MKVTGASIIPTTAANNANRPQLTPELLAAVGAKYSRSNEGLDQILSGIDRSSDPDRIVDNIFKFVDYGHQSIADMVPVAMFIDGISEILAYLIWAATPVQTACGQESSTRYIKLSMDGMIPHDQLGIADDDALAWNEANQKAFKAYEEALVHWESLLDENPTLARIPKDLLDDPTKNMQVARMKRNYAFDRARVYLPVGVATNMFLLMSARAWVGLCQYLLSSPLKEANTLGEKIVNELQLFSPRLIKHAVRKETTVRGIQSEMATAMTEMRTKSLVVVENRTPTPYLEAYLPDGVDAKDLSAALANHDNRYAWFGSEVRRTVVRFGWEAVGLAEIRDFNRHRTGTKHCPLIPVGFHSASDQCPDESVVIQSLLDSLAVHGYQSSQAAATKLAAGDPTYIYWMLLGTQLPFEHTTTGDKFIYEMELRTGAGAHYRYAGHCRDVLKLWYEKFPETQGLIHEGAAEPE